MRSIGRRTLLVVVASILSVALLSTLLTVGRRGIETSLRMESDLAAAQRLWERSVAAEGERIRAAVRETALRERTRAPSGWSGRLSDEAVATLSDRRVAGIVLFDDLGQTTFSWPQGLKTGVDPRRIAQILAARAEFHNLRLEGGDAGLVVGGTFDKSAGLTGGFVAVGGMEGVLAGVSETAGASVFLLGPAGNPLVARGSLGWLALRDAFRGRTADIFELSVGAQTIEVATIALRESTRGLIGQLSLARDVTVRSRWLTVVDSVAVTLLIGYVIALLALLRWVLSRDMAPLGASIRALSALADGETMVDAPGAERKDEIGMIARSIQVFRDRNRRVRDTEERRVRDWARQQEFIHVQMRQLADTLPSDAQDAFLGNLDQISAATSTGGGARSLAIAFKLMAERVCEQHERLDRLVKQLQDALATKTELFQLQQQVEVARRMQESMLPRGLLPRPDMEVAGFLGPAEEFDGGFYDYFPLSEGRVAAVIGQPGSGGLAAAFASATVRTSLRALLAARLPLGEALGRSAALLRGDDLTNGYAVAAMVFDPAARRLTWAGAGIDAPILVRRLGDAVDLPFAPSAPLVLNQEREFAEESFDLPPRSSVVVAAPGVFAAGNGFGAPLGRERAAELLRGTDDPTAAGLLDAMSRGLADHAGTAKRGRDWLCLVLRLLA
jgi:serine phosphatase RsbU (regulator of sigma subunit)